MELNENIKLAILFQDLVLGYLKITQKTNRFFVVDSKDFLQTHAAI